MAQVIMSSATSNVWSGAKFTSLLVDQISLMLKKEESFWNCIDYLAENHTCSTTDSLEMIDEQWRQRSAEWMFKVVDYYDLERAICSVAMTYLDRMFSVTSLHHQWSKLQCRLVTIACLKLAIKLYEPRTLNMEDMIKLGISENISFSSRAIIEMEYDILWKFAWNMHPPTAVCFAHYLICMLPDEVTQSTRYLIQELTKYMTELSICVYSFVKTKASSKAFACVLVALDCLDNKCSVSIESAHIFLERVHQVFGLSREDEEIITLKNELKDLLHHNTNLPEFIGLIRASNRSEQESESPKTAVVKSLNSSKKRSFGY